MRHPNPDSSFQQELAKGLTVDHIFSSNTGWHNDYYEKMTTYEGLSPAQRRQLLSTFAVGTKEEDSVFKYIDTSMPASVN